MQFLREATWEEVYEEWRKGEADQEFWKKVWKERGFRSWEEFNALHLELVNQLGISKWDIFEVVPEEIQHFHVGAYKSWLERARKAGDRSFLSIAKLEEAGDHPKIAAFRENFPAETQLIGFQKNGTVILYEGHHRSTAATQLLQAGKPPRSRITIALAELDPRKEYPFVDFRPSNRFQMWLWGRSALLERWYRCLKKEKKMIPFGL